jgi:UDP-glucose 4-epimerase
VGAGRATLILLQTGDSSPGHTIGVFGVGLVGTALVDCLRTRGNLTSDVCTLDWRESRERDRHLREIEVRIAGSLDAAPADTRRLTLVWSAGRAGFAAGREEIDSELDHYEAVLAFAERCASRFGLAKTRIVHFSSAGGLFEGQRLVDSNSVPRPRRPYGELKWEEERLLRLSAIPAVIVRLSSVYGRMRAGQRAGLISTLLLNGIRREVSSILGSMDTLRDFVWAGDIAEFVSRRILSEEDASATSTVLLASGRPVSIFEVQSVIEGLLGYKVYITHAPTSSNREDITFARSVMPSGWFPSDLRTNVGILYREAMRAGYGSLRPSRP